MNRVWHLTIALFLGFLLGFTIKNIYNLTAKQPCYWKNDPVLVNCAGTDISEETIQRAVKFWSEKGEHIYFYEYEVIDSICSDVRPLDGFIIINTQSNEFMEERVLAVTKRRSRLGVIQSAIITFKPGRHNFLLLLEHELGHAFGYSHTKVQGHVMHPYYDMMGEKFW